MLSIHRVRRIDAKRPFPESNWVEITFHGGFEEKFTVTIFLDHNPPEADLATINRFAEAIEKAVNAMPKAEDFERAGPAGTPSADVIDFPVAQA